MPSTTTQSSLKKILAGEEADTADNAAIEKATPTVAATVTTGSSLPMGWAGGHTSVTDSTAIAVGEDLSEQGALAQVIRLLPATSGGTGNSSITPTNNEDFAVGGCCKEVMGTTYKAGVVGNETEEETLRSDGRLPTNTSSVPIKPPPADAPLPLLTALSKPSQEIFKASSSSLSSQHEQERPRTRRYVCFSC